MKVHTVRPRVVIDAGSVGTWLDDQTAANLCAVRALRDYFCCIEDQGLIPKRWPPPPKVDSGLQLNLTILVESSSRLSLLHFATWS